MSGRPYLRRLNELEQRFIDIEERIPHSPEKDGLSILHGMIQELWRSRATGDDGAHNGYMTERSLRDIADLYKTAPAMNGESVSEPLPLRTTAPDFALPDANGELVSLRDFRGHPVVLAFYPLDWSPTCSDQLSLYEAEKQEFERFGARVVGISVDSIYSHGAWAAVRGITFPLLADFHPKGDVARRYHVYRTSDGFSERALYVVDGDGVLRYSHISPQLDHIPDIYELFEVLAEITGQPAPTSQASGDREQEPEPVGALAGV